MTARAGAFCVLALAACLHSQDASAQTTSAASRAPSPHKDTFIELNGRRLSLWDEYVIADADGYRTRPGGIQSAQVIWGGVLGDSTQQISERDARDRIVLLLPAAGSTLPDSTTVLQQLDARLRGAYAVAIITDNLALLGHHPLRIPEPRNPLIDGKPRAAHIYISMGTAAQLLGRETIDAMIEAGTMGRTVRVMLALDIP